MEKEKSTKVSYLKDENGKTYRLDDATSGVIDEINKFNCKSVLDTYISRVEHFRKRISEKGINEKDFVIFVINVDDINGGPIVRNIMPGFDWDKLRARGDRPYGMGYTSRIGIQNYLGEFDADAAEKLKGLTGVPVVVIDYTVAEVFEDDSHLFDS